MALPIAKLGWVAGVLDLKGKITNKNNQARATPQRVLYVESKELAVIRRLAELTGTNPEKTKERGIRDFMRRACSEHCPDHHIHTAVQLPSLLRWTITGAGLVVVISNTLPYMFSDDRKFLLQSAMVDSMQDTTLTGQGSGATKAALRRLKGLGWDLLPSFEEALREDPVLV